MTDALEFVPEVPETDKSVSNPARRSARFSAILNAPSNRQTPLGNDTAWALKLKAAVDCAVREMHVEVFSAKPVVIYDATDAINDMLIEMETSRGKLQAVRARSGTISFQWMPK